MSFLKLQIRHYSEHGDLVNIVSCAVNKVSVFRAKNPFYLDEYAKLMAGEPTNGRFNIQLDGRPYAILDHMLVGFPGRGLEATDYTVLDALKAGGLTQARAEKLLARFGLSGVQGAEIKSLPSCERRRVEILAALFHTEDRVMVLHDPFLSLSYEWREAFAELTAVFATENAKIVIITGLTERPESWIENPQIVRIEVDKVHRRTVGFSSEENAVDSLVHELRETLASEEQEDEASESELSMDYFVPPAPISSRSDPESAIQTVRADALNIPYSQAQDPLAASASRNRPVWIADLVYGMGRLSAEMSRLSLRTAPNRGAAWMVSGILLSLATLVYVLLPQGAPESPVGPSPLPGAVPVNARELLEDAQVMRLYPSPIRQSVVASFLEGSEIDFMPVGRKSRIPEDQPADPGDIASEPEFEPQQDEWDEELLDMY